MDVTTAASPKSAVPETPEPAWLGIAAAAAAIRNGEMTSETYAAALVQRARANLDLNAFTTIDEAAVLTAARDADRARAAGASAPLLGVPLGVKDSYLTKGLATSLGLERLAQFVPQDDAGAVRAIRDAGAVILGKNNLVEMSYGLTGDNAHFGQAKNPYDRQRVSGGSSSGSAVSVAAGIVPASLGGDTVGSIRVPASLCGVVGFKPTTGRWPRDGVAPISHTLDTTGVFARSVEDCALVDSVVADERTTDAPAADWGLKGARLAYAPRPFLDLVDAEVEARFNEMVLRLQDAGAEVVQVDLGDDFGALIQATAWSIFFHETVSSIADFLRRHDVPITFDGIYQGLKPQLREAWGHMALPAGGGAISADDYQHILSVSRPEIQRRLDRAFVARGVQAILLPTTPCTAPLIDQQMSFSIAGEEVSYTALANHTIAASSVGLPGISLPIGLSRSGLPIGLELDGQLGSDRALLSLAQRVEGVLDPLPKPL